MCDFETGLQNVPFSSIFSSSWYSITYQLYSTCCLDEYNYLAKSFLLRLLCMKYKLHNWEQCQLEWFWQWRWLQGQFYEVMAGVRYKRYSPPEALWLPTTTALGNFFYFFGIWNNTCSPIALEGTHRDLIKGYGGLSPGQVCEAREKHTGVFDLA